MQHPTTVDHYCILGEIARGGMGVVYRARDPALDREVALKVLLSGGVNSDAKLRFAREVEALAKLQHSAIVGIHAAGEVEGRPYLVMDLVVGCSLEERLARAGPLTTREANELLLALARAVQHAHEAGVLHRDLKPSNVLLDERGQPRLTDFGLARLADQGGDLSRTGMISGTPGFWAPEQAKGKPDLIDARTDVYGLGATLYACLTGEPPCRGSTLTEVLVRTLETPPPPPSSLRGDRDSSLDELCLRCLAKDPAERFADAAALVEVLERSLAGERYRRATRRRPNALLALLGLVAALAVGAWTWGSSSDDEGELERALRADGLHLAHETSSAMAWGLGHGSCEPPVVEELRAAITYLESQHSLPITSAERDAALDRLQATVAWLEWDSKSPTLDVPHRARGACWTNLAQARVTSLLGFHEQAWRTLRAQPVSTMRDLIGSEVVARDLASTLRRSAGVRSADELARTLDRLRHRVEVIRLEPSRAPRWKRALRDALEEAADAWAARLLSIPLDVSDDLPGDLDCLTALRSQVPELGPKMRAAVHAARARIERWAMREKGRALSWAAKVANACLDAFPESGDTADFETFARVLVRDQVDAATLDCARVILRAGYLRKGGRELVRLGKASFERLARQRPGSRAAAYALWKLHHLRSEGANPELERALLAEAIDGRLADLASWTRAEACLHLRARTEDLELGGALAKRGLGMLQAAHDPELMGLLLEAEFDSRRALEPERAAAIEREVKARALSLLLPVVRNPSNPQIGFEARRGLRVLLVNMARRHLLAEDLQAFEALGEDLRRIEPVDETEDESFVGMVAHAMSHRRAGRLAEAERALGSYAATAPRKSDFYACELIELRRAQGRHDEAAALQRMALREHRLSAIIQRYRQLTSQ